MLAVDAASSEINLGRSQVDRSRLTRPGLVGLGRDLTIVPLGKSDP